MNKFKSVFKQLFMILCRPTSAPTLCYCAAIDE